MAGRPGFQEYTQLLLASQNLHAIDEAEAQIAGWNAMIGYANSSGLNDGPQAIRELSGSYSRFVMNRDGSPVSGLQFNSDLSISASASNISAVVMTYFMNPNSGFAFGLTYPELYASGELDYIFKKTGGEKVAVDLGLLHIDPAKLQRANPFHIADGQSAKIYDPATLQTHTFQNNGWGVTRIDSRQIVNPNGNSIEEIIFDSDGNLVSTDHRWNNFDGSSGSDTLDAAGNFYMRETKTDGSSSYESRRADGSNGSGYTTANGTEHSQSYRPDGTYSINTSYADGSYEYEWKNSAGTHARGYVREDERNSETYNTDGSYSIFTKLLDGTNKSIVHNSDGTYRESINHRDGSFEIKSLDAQGIKLEESMTVEHKYVRSAENPDGSKEKTWQSPDVSRGSETIDKDGNFHALTVNADLSSLEEFVKVDGAHGYTELSASFSIYEGWGADGSHSKMKTTFIDSETKIIEDWQDSAKGELLYTLTDVGPTPGRHYVSKYNPENKTTETKKIEADGSETIETRGPDYINFTSLDANDKVLLTTRVITGYEDGHYPSHYSKVLEENGVYHELTIADVPPIKDMHFIEYSEAWWGLDGSVSFHEIEYRENLRLEAFGEGNIQSGAHVKHINETVSGQVVVFEDYISFVAVPEGSYLYGV